MVSLSIARKNLLVKAFFEISKIRKNLPKFIVQANKELFGNKLDIKCKKIYNKQKIGGVTMKFFVRFPVILVVALMALFCVIILGSCIGPGVEDYSFDVAQGYRLSRSSAHTIQVVPKDGWSSDNEIIPKKVVEIAWNNQYVIAKQLGMEKRNLNPNDSYELPNPSMVYYWVLDTEQRKRFGPFSKEEFENKLNELGLNDLILKEVESYRK
jgi:hypothetical protein